ncbi:MAG: hypothetical protein AAFQ68_04595 [Bacteroidota bacterium]
MTSQLSWSRWLLLLIGLVALYFLIQLLYRFVRRTTLFGRFQGEVREVVYAIQLLYEPVAIITLLISFAFIYPLFCGTFVLLSLLVGFNQFRNYLGGKLVQLNHMLTSGRRLRFQNLNGIISETGLLGLYMQTREGRHFVSYAQLLQQGYTIVSGTEVGGYYQLGIEQQAEDKIFQDRAELMDILSTVPYVDWSFKPEITQEANRCKVKLLVREEQHLRELIPAIKERGLNVSILNN